MNFANELYVIFQSIFTQLNDLDSLFGITKILRGTLSTEATMLNDVVSGHLEVSKTD